MFNPVRACVRALQIIPKLPRLNLLAAPVSSDLGSYHLFDCEGVNESRSCSFYMGFVDTLKDGIKQPSNLPNLLKDPSVKGTVVDYGQGVLLYSIVNLVIAILLPVMVGIFICFRYFCCCCRWVPTLHILYM